MHRKELFMLGNMGRLEENVITVVKKRGTTVFIIITIIFLSSSVLVNCLYLNSQYLPFFSSSSLPHSTQREQSANSCVMLSCHWVKP